MTELIDILESYDTVIIDTSCQKPSLKFTQSHLYGFEEIPTAEIKMQINCIDELIGAIEHQNAITIPEVTREIKASYKGLKRISEIIKKKNKRIEVIGSDLHKKNKILFHQFINYIFHAYKASKTKEFETQEPSARTLDNILSLLVQNLSLDHHNRPEHGPGNSPSKTDIRLLSTLYWYHVIYGLDGNTKKVALATNDTHIPCMTMMCTEMLSSKVFLPYNYYFRKTVLDSTPKVYMPHNKNQKPTKKINPRAGFGIRNMTPAQTQELKEQIAGLWKQFYAEIKREAA